MEAFAHRSLLDIEIEMDPGARLDVWIDAAGPDRAVITRDE